MTSPPKIVEANSRGFKLETLSITTFPQIKNTLQITNTLWYDGVTFLWPLLYRQHWMENPIVFRIGKNFPFLLGFIRKLALSLLVPIMATRHSLCHNFLFSFSTMNSLDLSLWMNRSLSFRRFAWLAFLILFSNALFYSKWSRMVVKEINIRLRFLI